MQVIDTDKAFAASNLASALLQGSPSAGIPSLTSINGTPLAASSSDSAFATNNVETVVVQGATVSLGGTGFDTAHGAAVDLFCACTGGKIPTIFLDPGNAGLTSTKLTFNLPSAAILPTGPGAFVISNKGSDGSYSKKCNAVSVPVGEKITITAVSQSGTTITADGTGFSKLTVINFFNSQSGGVVNLGGFGGGGANIPLTVASAHQFTFTKPAAAVPGASFVEAFNPPFVPYTSSGTGSGGAFTLK